MTDIIWVEAEPYTGYLKHAINAEAVMPKHHFAWGRAACGLHGRVGMGAGGLRPNRDRDGKLVPFTATTPNPNDKRDWNDRQMNEWCPKCITKLRRLAAKKEQP